MPDTINQQLNVVFEKASLSHARRLLTSLDDFEKLSDINRDASEQRDELTRRYREEYDARVDAERQRLYRQATHASLDHPAPFGVQATSSDAVDQQAHQHVQLAHAADLQGAADEAQRRIESLLQDAHQRHETQGLATDAFLRAGERRSGQDRRAPKQSQD